MASRYGVPESTIGVRFGSAGPGRFWATCGGATFGCSLEDGRILWHAPIAVPSYVPTYHEGRIYLLSSGYGEPARFICLDAETGAVVYDVRHQLEWRDKPTVGTLWGECIAYGTRAGQIVLFRLANGSLACSHLYKDEVYQPVADEDRLLVTAADGNLLVFE
jgi:outer membrane protein assembly factor BamB